MARHLSAQRAPTADAHRRTAIAVQTVAPSLLGGLCARAQGTVCGHPHSGADHHFVDSVFRADIATGVCESRRHGGDDLRAHYLCNGHDCDADWDGSGAPLKVRRLSQFPIGRHSVGGRPNGSLSVQHVYRDWRTFHTAPGYDLGVDHRAGVDCADGVPDNVHTRRKSPERRHAGAHAPKAGSRNCHLSAGGQSGHVGDQHAGEVTRRKPSDSAELLRTVGVDDHHARLDAAGDFLSIPQYGVFVRDLEASVQDQADVFLNRKKDEMYILFIMHLLTTFIEVMYSIQLFSLFNYTPQ